MKIKVELLLISMFVGIYALLEVNLFDNEVIFALLSPNENISLMNVIYFTSFLVMRLAIYLILPLYLIIRGGLILQSKLQKTKETPDMT